MTKNYLQLEFGSGLFFDYSKEEKQGYEKHTSSKGSVSYRKYYKEGVSGVLESISLYDGKFGQQISMNIKDGDNVYYVPIDIYDQRGNVDTYAESLIKLLPSLNKGEKVTVKAYNFTPENERYAKIGISIIQDGEKVKSSLTNAYYKEGKLVEGNIPAIEWVEKLGKKKPSASSLEKKDDFLLGVLTKETERLKWVQGESSSTQSQTNSEAPKLPPVSPSEAFEPATNVKQEQHDDLPF